jgi:hypothetical protein
MHFFSKLKKTYSQVSRRSGGCAYIPHGCAGSSEEHDYVKDREKKLK